MRTRRRSRRPAFVPRALLETALVAVVPSIAGCASRRQEPTVAQVAFVAAGGSAEADADTLADGAANVIDAAYETSLATTNMDASATARVTSTSLGISGPLPVAHQGFENIIAPAVAARAFENRAAVPHDVTADAGAARRRRR